MLEGEPQTFKEVVNSTESLMGKEVIKSEIDSILHNHTWELMDLPPGCKPLSFKWVFKRKRKVYGSIDKYKARLVIKGYKKTKGLDYFDMKDLGLVDIILGIKIKRTSDGLILSQSHYVGIILGKFDKDNSSIAKTLVDVTLHFSKTNQGVFLK